VTDINVFATAIHAWRFCVPWGAKTRGVIETHGALSDWNTFAASWDDLGLDTYRANEEVVPSRPYSMTRARRIAIVIDFQQSM
jgi:hypothetical protein